MGALTLGPIALREARQFVAQHHRHNEPPRGWLFGVALRVDEQIVAVGIAGRPVARGAQDGLTVELLRVCIAPDSRLYVSDNAEEAHRGYGALCRAAAALGYRRAITYTLASESGTSLRASGFTQDAILPEREQWQHSTGPRSGDKPQLWGAPKMPTESKVRWTKVLATGA